MPRRTAQSRNLKIAGCQFHGGHFHPYSPVAGSGGTLAKLPTHTQAAPLSLLTPPNQKTQPERRKEAEKQAMRSRPNPALA
jgi:hypothetical protein